MLHNYNPNKIYYQITCEDRIYKLIYEVDECSHQLRPQDLLLDDIVPPKFRPSFKAMGRRLCCSSHRSSGSHTLLFCEKPFWESRKIDCCFLRLRFFCLSSLSVNSFLSFFIKNHASCLRSLSYNLFPRYFLVSNWFHLPFRGKGLGARLTEEVNNLFTISKALRKLNCQVTEI